MKFFRCVSHKLTVTCVQLFRLMLLSRAHLIGFDRCVHDAMRLQYFLFDFYFVVAVKMLTHLLMLCKTIKHTQSAIGGDYKNQNKTFCDTFVL